jgi:protein TonB
MFAESMLETSWGQRTRRGWMTLTSFALQVLLLGILITVPLLRTVGIPLARTISTPITLGRRNAAPPTVIRPHTVPSVGVISPGARLLMPSRIPTTIVWADDGQSQDTSSVVDGLGDSSVDLGATSGINLPVSGTTALMPLPPALPVHTFRTSSMLQGSLIRRVEPVYPPMARTVRIQGSVVLDAVISKSGAIEQLQAISGHPMLIPAALEAVSQWRYRPYILNGEAIEVDTRITVNFILQAQ